MPGLSLTRRLAGIDGRPSAAAYIVLVLLMALAAAIGYAAAPGGEPRAQPERAVGIGRVSGDLPIARRAERPRLRPAAPVPALALGRSGS